MGCELGSAGARGCIVARLVAQPSTQIQFKLATSLMKIGYSFYKIWQDDLTFEIFKRICSAYGLSPKVFSKVRCSFCKP